MLNRALRRGVCVVIAIVWIALAIRARAHPGGKDASGCHTCRTNCPKWGLGYGQYHCHGSKRSASPRPKERSEPIRLFRGNEIPLGEPLPQNSIRLPSKRSDAAVQVQVRVLSVVDGDTFVGRMGERLLLFQLRDIEAPELEQQYGREARSRLANWVHGKLLTVWTETERNCIVAVQAKTLDGTDVAVQQVSEGLAWADPLAPESIRLLEANARAERLGLWQAADPQPPWEYREQRRMAARS